MKNEAPRKRRFQMHLSTAVILMIAAGGLIWVNTEEREELVEPLIMPIDGKQTRIASIFRYSNYLSGWPFTARVRNEFSFPDGNLSYEDLRPGQTSYFGSMLAVNVSVALLLLLAVWFLCEWWIRRRAGRKGT